jgi:hypothetical protein
MTGWSKTMFMSLWATCMVETILWIGAISQFSRLAGRGRNVLHHTAKQDTRAQDTGRPEYQEGFFNGLIA